MQNILVPRGVCPRIFGIPCKIPIEMSTILEIGCM